MFNLFFMIVESFLKVHSFKLFLEFIISHKIKGFNLLAVKTAEVKTWKSISLYFYSSYEF